jgi:hypothetical protein
MNRCASGRMPCTTREVMGDLTTLLDRHLKG